MEEFKVFFDKTVSEYDAPKLDGAYGRKNKKKQDIVGALKFWKGIQNFEHVVGVYAQKNETHVEVSLREMLKEYNDDANPYVRIVARMEQLPDEVFQRMLWFHNIDFQSREAFLRRLIDENIAEIYATYDALFGKNPHLPVCMTDGLANKLRTSFGKQPEVCSLLSEPINGWYRKRYESVPALAVNLLDLDFGRALYADAQNDIPRSQRLENQFEGRFIVNREYGKYAWLFTAERSNPLWEFKNSTVKLGAHFCPGFYMTMLFIPLFVILSFWGLMRAPFAFMGSEPMGKWDIVETAMGLPALFVLLRAGAVSLWDNVLSEQWEKFTECLGETYSSLGFTHEFDKRFWKKAGKRALETIIAVAIFGLFCLAAWLFHRLSGSIVFGIITSAFLSAYAYVMITEEKWMWPTKVPYAGKPAVVALPLYVVWQNRETVLQALQYILHNFSALIMWAFAIGFAWACSYVAEKFVVWIENKDPERKRLDYVSNLFNWVLGTTAIVGLTFFLYGIFILSTDGDFLLILVPVMIMPTIASVFLSYAWVYLNPERIYWTKRAVEMGEQSKQYYFPTDRIRTLAGNTWVRNLEDPKPVLHKVYKLWCIWPGKNDLFYEKMARSLNAELYSLIDGYLNGFSAVHRMAEKKAYFCYFFKGVSFEEASLKIQEENRLWKKIKESLYWLYFFILFGWLFTAIYKTAKTLYKWARHAWFVKKEILDKSCPFVERLQEVERLK